MTENDDRLREIYQLGHAPGEDRSRCPSPDALARAVAGEASAEDRMAIARHLMSCSACSGEFRDATQLRERTQASRSWNIRPFARAALAAAALLLLLIGGGWSLSLLRENRDLSSELARSRQPRPVPVMTDGSEIRELREESARQRERIARLEQAASRPDMPSVNVPVIDLDPSGVLRGESRGEREIVFPSGATVATLILNTRVSARYDNYGVTMSDRAGKVLWTSAGLIRSPDDTFTISIPKLPDGRYTLSLAGVRGSKQIRMENYVIRIRS